MKEEKRKKKRKKKEERVSAKKSCNKSVKRIQFPFLLTRPLSGN